MTLQQAYELAAGHAAAGRFLEAEQTYRQILSQLPGHAESLYGLGVVLFQTGRAAEALPLFRSATSARPGVAQFWHGQGVALARLSQVDEAVAALQRALAIRDDFADAHQSLGNVWLTKSEHVRAIDAFSKVLSLRPGFAEAICGLANALINAGELELAIALCRDGLKLHNDKMELARMLVRALREAGQLDDAIALCRERLASHPDSQLHGDLLFTLHFHPGYDRRALREEHRRWYEIHARPLARFIVPHENDPTPDRRMRVGYVAHDLGDHPLGRFFLTLLSHHDHGQVEVFCYCDSLRPSAIGRRIGALPDVWRDTADLSDVKMADVVRSDRIDILVDLTTHTDGNRLLTFARKPAPVQATYLAYCSTTGLEAIDYRLTDAYLDPTDTNPSDYAEKSIRLPGCYWCYAPPEQAPGVGPLPAGAPQPVTFGCLNDFAKVSGGALSLWARLLREVPDSQLVLYSKAGSHRRRALDAFIREGIKLERLVLVPFQPVRGYYATYSQIDIALDPFPWVGGTTTCDALWMGVPVVTLPGQTAVSRGGASILSNIGLPELVARSPDDYVGIAAGLAGDLPRVASLRASLRQRMLASPLMDATRFARGIEAAYRQIWRSWCNRQSFGFNMSTA
jgi:predicted O-linked N-acetylglucosamine transferase (SPINDLY family)